ncbi:hypothetical protein FOZ62_009974, partial [Perkinsus olseni]
EDPLAERLGHLESQMSELIGGMSTLKSIVSKQGDAMNRLAKFTRDVHIFDSSCDIEYFDSYFSYDRTDDGEYRLIWSGREPLLKSITFELKPTGRMSISYSSNEGRAQIAGPSEEITKSFHEVNPFLHLLTEIIERLEPEMTDGECRDLVEYTISNPYDGYRKGRGWIESFYDANVEKAYKLIAQHKGSIIN